MSAFCFCQKVSFTNISNIFAFFPLSRWLFHFINWRLSIHQQAKSTQLKNTYRLFLLTTTSFGLWALCTMTVLWKILKEHCSLAACDVHWTKLALVMEESTACWLHWVCFVREYMEHCYYICVLCCFRLWNFCNILWC